jgi:branched-subunit amino acid transport protein
MTSSLFFLRIISTSISRIIFLFLSRKVYSISSWISAWLRFIGLNELAVWERRDFADSFLLRVERFID